MAGIVCPGFATAGYLLLPTSRFSFQNTAVFEFQTQQHGKLFSISRTLLHFRGSWTSRFRATAGEFVELRFLYIA